MNETETVIQSIQLNQLMEIRELEGEENDLEYRIGMKLKLFIDLAELEI